MRSPPVLRLVRVDLTKRLVLRLALPRLLILSEVLGVGGAVDHFDLGGSGEHALDDAVLDEDFDFVFHRDGLYQVFIESRAESELIFIKHLRKSASLLFL